MTVGRRSFSEGATRGPITIDACFWQNRRSSVAQHGHWWLWVPDRAEPVIGRAFARPVGLSGTTWMKIPIHISSSRKILAALIRPPDGVRGGLNPSTLYR